jgi:uncharacterized protein (DUF952 family)
MRNRRYSDGMSHSGRVLHLADREAWQEAERSGTYARSTRGVTVAQTGFVHASTASQLPHVADFVYSDVPCEHLTLLVIDQTVLASHGVEVRWENLDGGDELFPHLYGPVPVDAVVAGLPVTREDAGHLVLPDLTAFDVVSGPPTSAPE